jgi:dTDP-4-amino-4,6-dideoxygalactose transaminase
MIDVAAMGLNNLKLEKKTNRDVQCRYLNANLRGVITPIVPEGSIHVYHQYTIRVPGGKREALRTYLQEHEVGSEIYYPVPIHKQSFYSRDFGDQQSFPESERAASEVLSLPVHPALSQGELETIVNRVNEFLVS